MIVRVTAPGRSYRVRGWRESYGHREDGEPVFVVEFDRTVTAPAYVVVPDDLDRVGVEAVWPDAPATSPAPAPTAAVA